MFHNIKVSLLLTITLGFILMACQKQHNLEPSQEQKRVTVTNTMARTGTEATTKYTAEELFQGVFFADGIVVSKMPTLSAFSITNLTNDASIIKEYKKIQKETFQKFSAKFPVELKEFERKITSGNQIMVQQTINETYPKIKIILNEISNSNAIQNENSASFASYRNEFKQTLGNSGIDKTDVNAIAAFTKKFIQDKNNSALNLSNKEAALVVGPVIVAAVAAVAAVAVYCAVWFWDSCEATDYLSSNPNSLINAVIINEAALNLAR